MGYLNISEENKCFVWLFPRTGTNHMIKILNYFNFNFYKVIDGKIDLMYETTMCNHYCGFFNGSDEYKFMVSVRNPYSREVSRYRLDKITNKESTTFEDYINNNHLFLNNPNKSCIDFNHRFPDYIIRLENLYEDYCKVPFITNSVFYKDGYLDKFVKNKINESPTDKTDWKSLYNERIASIVYEKYKKYFEQFGYDPNSWKN